MRRQHAVKRLSLHSGLLWFQASTNLNKAVSEYPKSSVCRAVRPRRSSRPGDLSGGQDSICRSWPTLPLLLQSPATSCVLLCCLLTSSSATGSKTVWLPGHLPLGERYSEASRPDFRDAFSAGKSPIPRFDSSISRLFCCSKEVPLPDVDRKAGLPRVHSRAVLP